MGLSPRERERWKRLNEDALDTMEQWISIAAQEWGFREPSSGESRVLLAIMEAYLAFLGERVTRGFLVIDASVERPPSEGGSEGGPVIAPVDPFDG